MADYDAYECGYRARLDGCYRVLCNYESEEELRQWQRGYGDADMMARIDQPIRPPSDQCTHCSGKGEFIGGDLCADVCPICDGFGYLLKE